MSGYLTLLILLMILQLPHNHRFLLRHLVGLIICILSAWALIYNDQHQISRYLRVLILLFILQLPDKHRLPIGHCVSLLFGF